MFNPHRAFHTGSMFVASLGMFEILASFPVSIFLYRILFRVAYLGNIQILSIFVVLGVGADDVFVFFDAFKQSAYEPIEVSGTTLGRCGAFPITTHRLPDCPYSTFDVIHITTD